jgi:hypothetical protein
MLNNQETFVRVVVDWTEKAKGNALAVARLTIQKMNDEIVITTPVDTGYLRNSYFAAVNQLPTGQGGSGTVAINAVVAGLQLGDIYYLGNVAAYARRVEYGFVGLDSLGRRYAQKGRFWMARVVDSASNFAALAANEVAALQ